MIVLIISATRDVKCILIYWNLADSSEKLATASGFKTCRS